MYLFCNDGEQRADDLSYKYYQYQRYAEHKADWIDFDASPMLTEDQEKVTNELIKLIIAIANGEKHTKNEINGYSEISIFKDGVVL